MRGNEYGLPRSQQRKKGVCLVIALFFLVIASTALGAAREAIQSLAQKLERWDVEEAWSEAKEILGKDPHDVQLLELASEIAFHRGDYEESLKLIKSAVELGGENDKRRALLLFVEETMKVLLPFKRHETPHFVILFDEPQDEVLLDDLSEALERTYQVMAERYGFEPKEKIRVELFPDSKAFYLASTLSVRDIEVTGAVGLTKFNKLQFLSPRALIYGYRWLDAISHEYMHYLIVKMTANHAPIWFHEGLAKYEETRWRDGPSYLSPLYQTLLSRALTERKLIRFERMEPSLIHLETPEEVQLAYAQAASAIEFIVAQGGPSAVQEIMKRMARSETRGASDAMKEVLALEFYEFESKWREFLASKEMKKAEGVRLHRYKVREGWTDEERLDMEEIKSLVARNRAHLGDRLKERGRVGAAIIEYRRALGDSPDSVPILNRLSSALAELGKDEEALDILKRAVELSPDHPTPYTRMGKIHLRRGNFEEAKKAFQEVLQINPFDPEVHLGLATVYERSGDEVRARKEREIARRLTSLK